MKRVPRLGTAVHLQELFYRKQMNGSPAGVPRKNVQGGANAAIRQRRPPTGHLSEITSERHEKYLLFGELFASAAPPSSRGLRALFKVFFQRRVLRQAGFRRTSLECRGVILNDHGVQRRRFGAKHCPERTEAKTPMKEDDGGTNPHRRGRCPRNGLRICIRPERIHGVVRHPKK